MPQKTGLLTRPTPARQETRRSAGKVPASEEQGRTLGGGSEQSENEGGGFLSVPLEGLEL